jgi:hypothetical protein
MLTHYLILVGSDTRETSASSATNQNAVSSTLREAMLRDTLEIAQSRTSATNADVLVFIEALENESAEHATSRFKAWLEAHGIDYPNVHIFLSVPAPDKARNGENSDKDTTAPTAPTAPTPAAELHHAFCIAHERGTMPALALYANAPTVPDAVLNDAETALRDSNTAILGATDDGTLYALGLQKPDAGLFAGQEHASRLLAVPVLAGLRATYERVQSLPAWYAIAGEQGVERLRGEVHHDPTLRHFHVSRALAAIAEA